MQRVSSPWYVIICYYLFFKLILHVGEWRWQGWKRAEMGRDLRCAVYRVPGIFFFIFYLFTILTKTYALGGEWR